MDLLRVIKSGARRIFNRLKTGETDALYKVLYDQVHDLQQAKELSPNQTRETFTFQWETYPEGEYLLSDPWFKANVARILSRQELLIPEDWFKGKKVLDAGCGNGRWAYGFCELGADLTCVDQSAEALRRTQDALQGFDNPKRFLRSPLESLDSNLDGESFDLVFSWGVLHHCSSYNRALQNVTSMVKPGGILYLYLYGRESVPLEQDLNLFKKRVQYNVLMDAEQRYRFLLKQAGGDERKVHTYHDIYAPLINRRFTFEEVKCQLKELGFTDITRTIDHTEVFVRATKGESVHSKVFLSPKTPPYWFQGRHL